MLNKTKIITFTCTILINIYSTFGKFEIIFCFFTNNMNTYLGATKINPREKYQNPHPRK